MGLGSEFRPGVRVRLEVSVPIFISGSSGLKCVGSRVRVAI